jgi:hypothetical protein
VARLISALKGPLISNLRSRRSRNPRVRAAYQNAWPNCNKNPPHKFERKNAPWPKMMYGHLYTFCYNASNKPLGLRSPTAPPRPMVARRRTFRRTVAWWRWQVKCQRGD